MSEQHRTWITDVLRPLIVGIMVACIAWAVAELVHVIAPAWNATYILILCILAALEGHFSEQWMYRRRLLGGQRNRVRLIELAMFFLIAKLARYTKMPPALIWDELKQWPTDPLLLFDPESTVAFLLATTAWGAALQTSRDLEELSALPSYTGDEATPQRRLWGRFMTGGILLLLISGFARIGLSAIWNLDRPMTRGLVLNVLIYFALGLFMLGQVDQAAHIRQWRIHRVSLDNTLWPRRISSAAILLIIAALLAFILPTGYTLGILEPLAQITGFVLEGILFVVTTFFTLAALPFLWLFSLFSQTSPETPDLPQPPTLPDLTQVETSGGVSWWGIARTILFWLLLLAGVTYIVRTYIHDHPEIGHYLRRLRPLYLLKKAWRLIRGWLRRQQTLLRQRIPQIRRRIRMPSRPNRSLRRGMGPSTPRERILRYYRQFLHLAELHGLPRRRPQTPYEYRDAVEIHLVQIQSEIHGLTESFVEAYYSAHPIEPHHEQEARTLWNRIRTALKEWPPSDSDHPSS